MKRFNQLKSHLQTNNTFKNKLQNEYLLPYDLAGNTSSKNLIVFLHGWPDSNKLWDNIAPAQEQDNLVLRISYPNYDKRVQELWGRDMPTITRGIKETIDHVKGGREYKVFIVSHDWGAHFTYLFDKAYPNYIKNGIVMDIGYMPPDDAKTLIFALSYQLYLALLFVLPRSIGNPMTVYFMKRFAMSKDYKLEEGLDASINYMYYYMWRPLLKQIGIVISMITLSCVNVFFLSPLALFIIYKIFCNITEGIQTNKQLNNSNNDDFINTKQNRRRYKPSFPLAFIYGIKKPFMFHQDKMIQELNNTEKCEVIGVKQGHWVMIGNEKMVNDLITKRLKDM